MASSPSQYWCNHCSKYSSIESLLGAVICQDCRHRLPEFISPPPPPPDLHMDDEFFRIFHLIADSSPPSPPPPPFHHDYLRLNIGGWGINQEPEGNQDREGGQPYSRRRRRGALGADHLGIRRHRIVRWADGSDQNAIEVRLQLPERDTYFANPGDYVDEEGYEAFLRVLAERDNGGDRGSPPAAKGAVMGLETGVVRTEEEVMVCVVCRDLVSVGELVKKLPCRHGYHGDCIVQWLGVRNSCPVCRFELPTDDLEYETERKKKLSRRADGVVDGTTSAASAGVASSSDSHAVQSSYDSID